MRMMLIALMLLGLAACGSAPRKENAPAPDVVQVPVATFVPISGGLTQRCAWPVAGKPSEVFAVANGRKRCLLQYEAQLDAIERVQGKPVPQAQAASR